MSNQRIVCVCLVFLASLLVQCIEQPSRSSRSTSSSFQDDDDAGMDGFLTDIIWATADDPPCRDHEAPFGGHCYFTAGIGKMEYSAAKQMCTSAGARPVDIHSVEENEFVFSLLFIMTRRAWIGLIQTESAFAWESGQPLTYANWEAGEPESSTCVAMRGPRSDLEQHGRWDSTSCSDENKEIICERIPTE